MSTKTGILRIFAIAVGAMAVLTSMASQKAGANLIVNGDFEACTGGLAPAPGTLSDCGWTFANNAGGETGGNPGRAVRLETGGSPTLDPTAQQTVAGLMIGTQYTLSWQREVRFNFSGAANGPSFGVFLDSQTFATALFLLPTGQIDLNYVSESVMFTATATSHTFIFAGELDGRTNGAGTTDVSHRLDNVSLLAATSTIPEPGILGLFGGGLIVFGTVRRRRRG